MPQARIRVYAELNDFLPSRQRGKEFSISFDAKTSIKHIIESLGIPHTEVDLILINGSAVDFQVYPVENDLISVYPVFESLDISEVSRLRPKPLRSIRFVLDAHLGKLSAYLRMLGFDALYENDYSDAELAEISSRQKRVLLTRDLGVLKRNLVTHGAYVRSEKPRDQLLEVLDRFDLFNAALPFSRCLKCNEVLRRIEKQEILSRLPPRTSDVFFEFKTCPKCNRLYWKGSHYIRMKKMVEGVLTEGREKKTPP